MAFYIPPYHIQPRRTASTASLPQRSDSLRSNDATPQAETLSLTKIISATDDDLRDARRVHSHGQEEDLKYALNKLIGRVEELSSILKSAYKYQSELETSLTLAKSNLKMAQANSELLEDSMKRDAERARKRVSVTESPSSVTSPNPEGARYSIDSPSPSPGAPPQSADAAKPETPGGLFSSLSRVRGQNHIASASMPSLVPESSLKRIEELTKSLESERNALKAAKEEKLALESELEQLSQALFEEANKMVAQERMKAADAAEELVEARRQKEALLAALRVVEGENGTLRAAAAAAGMSIPDPSFKPSSRPPDADSSFAHELERRTSRSSSEIALKSPVLRPPRSPARSTSGRSRTPSLTVSTTPVVSSPLAISASLSHSPPEMRPPLPTAHSNTSDAPTEVPSPRVSSSIPASAAAALAPALKFEGPTPPAVEAAPASAPAAPVPMSAPAAVRPSLSRRATVPAPDPNLDDPNLPTSLDEADPASASSSALFNRPSLPSLTSLPQLPTLASLRSSLPASPLGSPMASPFIPTGSASVNAPPAEESPWADVRSMSPSLRPALSRVSSISSAAGERIGVGLGKAREVLAAGIASAFEEDPPMRSPPLNGSPTSSFRPDVQPRRMSSFEVAAFGLRR